MVTAGRPTYDVGMRASAEPDLTAVLHRRLPRPVVWLLWLLGALVGSVVLGFLAGLARPREPDPWAVAPPPPPPVPEAAPVPETVSTSEPAPASETTPAEDD